MPKFVTSHTTPPGQVTKEQLNQLTQAAQQDSQIKGLRSFSNLSEGKITCIMESPDRDTLAAWFEKMQLPVDSIVQMEIEGERGVIETL